MTTLDHSTINGPDYDVIIHFQWRDVPFSVLSWQDKLAVAWGGELTMEEAYCSISYCKASLNRWIGDSYSIAGNYTEEAIDTGGYFYFGQVDNGSIVQGGSIAFRLFAANSASDYTKVIAQYGHQTVAVTGVTLTISYPPGLDISFGLGYDTTPQASRTIMY